MSQPPLPSSFPSTPRGIAEDVCGIGDEVDSCVNARGIGVQPKIARLRVYELWRVRHGAVVASFWRTREGHGVVSSIA